MGLTWIDGARINGADEEERTPDKETAMGKTITSDKRLYDTDQHGIRFLAYPVGAQVPEAEYKRLAGAPNKMRVPAENKLMQPAENKVEARPLKRMNKDELRAAATAAGVEWNEDMTNRELIEALEGQE